MQCDRSLNSSIDNSFFLARNCLVDSSNIQDSLNSTNSTNSHIDNHKYFVHELLNPINIIYNSADIILNDVYIDSVDVSLNTNRRTKMIELLKLIKEQSLWCQNLSEEFLENSKNDIKLPDIIESPSSSISIDSTDNIFTFSKSESSSRENSSRESSSRESSDNSSEDSCDSDDNYNYSMKSHSQSRYLNSSLNISQNLNRKVINIKSFLKEYIKKFLKINQTLYNICGIVSNINRVDDDICISLPKSDTYLKIILDNILINAIKYSDVKHKYIYLKVYQIDNILIIKICNFKPQKNPKNLKNLLIIDNSQEPYINNINNINNIYGIDNINNINNINNNTDDITCDDADNTDSCRSNYKRKSHSLGLDLINNMCEKIGAEWNFLDNQDNDTVEFNLYLTNSL